MAVFFFMRKKLRIFRVREPFKDPYIDTLWSPGQDVEEDHLLKSGWKPSDIDRAVGNLLVPHLLPKQENTEE